MKRLFIKIADTPSKREMGLMFCKSMDKNNGMMFKFPYAHHLRFWMKNTYIPLDIAFVKENGEIEQIAKISPMSRKIICSDSNCLMAIEANDGFFDKNMIKSGDIIEIENDEIGGCCISFKKNKGK